MRIGLVGGTFDPVHLGHLAMAEEARVHLGLDRVMFLPAGQPWIKEGKPLSPAEDRVQMLRLAIASNPHFQLCLEEVNRPGPTYTVDTLQKLMEELRPETSIFFIVGQDAMQDFHRWKEPQRVLDLCTLVVVERTGHAAVDLAEIAGRVPTARDKVQVMSMPPMGISSTEVRRRATAGESLRYHVPDAVAEYIEERGLYRGESQEQRGRAAAGARNARIERLLSLAVSSGALKYGDFTLTSGKKSKYYFDGRLLSLDPVGSRLVAEALLPVLRAAGVDAVGGPTLGADPIVAAIAVVSGQQGRPIPGFIVRKEAKAHGTGQAIEGPLLPGTKVAIVDDTCTTGGSLFQAIEAAEAVGCQVVKVAAVLDRNEGGSEELRRRGYDFAALLRANQDGEIQPAQDA